MREFVLKKNSWHYKIANFMHGNADCCYDICSYTRRFFIGLFFLIFVTAALILIGGVVLFGIGNIFGWLFLGYQFDVLSSVVIGFVLGGLIVYTIEAVKSYRNKPSFIKKDPGFVGLVYRKFKDKTCTRIKFE